MNHFRHAARRVRLDQAHRVVAESTARIQRQEALIKRVRVQNRPELEAAAEALLVDMRQFHQVLEQVLRVWVEVGSEYMSTPDFLRDPKPTEAERAVFVSQTRKPQPTKYCRTCCAPGYPASGVSHRCKGRRRPGPWVEAAGEEYWESCLWCEATGVRENRECEHCGGVGWRRRYPWS
jgi:hypothetical protein